jgi:hypothetical protein
MIESISSMVNGPILNRLQLYIETETSTIEPVDEWLAEASGRVDAALELGILL